MNGREVPVADLNCSAASNPNVLPMGLADEDGGVHWWLFPDLLALDQMAEWLERTTGKRNL